MKRENLGVFTLLLSSVITVSMIVLVILKMTIMPALQWRIVFSPVLVPLFLLCAVLAPLAVVSLIMGFVTYLIDKKNGVE